MMTSTLEASASGKKIGIPHTEESKAKISAANKGKVSWNAGKKHSEETRQKIAQKTKEAVTKRKTELAASLGMNLQEYEDYLQNIKLAKKAEEPKKGLTEDGRRRISQSLKERWQSEEYRKAYAAAAASRNVSESTRQKISEAVRLKWQDEEYRKKCMFNISNEQRLRISQTLREKWKTDQAFRDEMIMKTRAHRTPEWRAKMSQKMRHLWGTAEYRARFLVNSPEKAPKNATSGTRKSSSIKAPKVRITAEVLSSDKNNQIVRKTRTNSTIKASKSNRKTVSYDWPKASGGFALNKFDANPVEPEQAVFIGKGVPRIPGESAQDLLKREVVYRKAKLECAKGAYIAHRSLKDMLGPENWVLERQLRLSSLNAKAATTAITGRSKVKSGESNTASEDIMLEMAIIREWIQEGQSPDQPQLQSQTSGENSLSSNEEANSEGFENMDSYIGMDMGSFDASMSWSDVNRQQDSQASFNDGSSTGRSVSGKGVGDGGIDGSDDDSYEKEEIMGVADIMASMMARSLSSTDAGPNRLSDAAGEKVVAKNASNDPELQTFSSPDAPEKTSLGSTMQLKSTENKIYPTNEIVATMNWEPPRVVAPVAKDSTISTNDQLTPSEDEGGIESGDFFSSFDPTMLIFNNDDEDVQVSQNSVERSKSSRMDEASSALASRGVDEETSINRRKQKIPSASPSRNKSNASGKCSAKPTSASERMPAKRVSEGHDNSSRSPDIVFEDPDEDLIEYFGPK